MSSQTKEKKLFVTPASNAEARGHLNRTVRNPVTFDFVKQYLQSNKVKTILDEKQTFGAWGVNSGGGSDETFFNMMDIGDIVAIYSQQQIEFLGEVIAKEEKPNPALARALWDVTNSYDLVYFLEVKKAGIPFAKFRSTLGYSDNYRVQRFMRVDLRGRTLDDTLNTLGLGNELTTSQLPEAFEGINQALESKRQVILYGPVGVGKTYVAKQFAVWFLTGKIVQGDEVSASFKELQEDGLAELVQFHPAYSYEEFVEGIRPSSDGHTFEVQPGIFKKICRVAEAYVINYDANVAGYAGTAPHDIPDDVKLQRYGINKIDQEKFVKVSGFAAPTIQAMGNTKGLEAFRDLKNFAGFYVLRLSEGSAYADKEDKVYNYVEGIPGSKQLTEDLDHGKVAFAYYSSTRGGIFGFGFLQGYRKRQESGNRILIIDEINRGNTAKIFGELLYALEYRDERVRLQYSGSGMEEGEQYLSVPKNLYLIGTMNTADRNIALVDLALRRRFHFIQLVPDYDLLTRFLALGDKFVETDTRTKYAQSTDQDEKTKALSILALKRLNERVASRHGKDKQVGHVFLMKLRTNTAENFVLAWKYDILPLLEEYYYSNYEQLSELVGTTLVDPVFGIKAFGSVELTTALEKMCEI